MYLVPAVASRIEILGCDLQQLCGWSVSSPGRDLPTLVRGGLRDMAPADATCMSGMYAVTYARVLRRVRIRPVL